MSEQFASLFTPWKVGGVEVKNRIVLVPMSATGLIDWQLKHRVNTERFDFFRERSQNEVGLFIAGGLTLNSMVGKKWIYEKPDIFDGVKPLIEELHANGSRLFMQATVGAGGRNFPMMPPLEKIADSKTLRKLTGGILNLDPWLVDADDKVPSYWAYNTPYRGRQVTKEEIAQYVFAMGRAARMAKDAGVDGIEIHAMHFGYLLDQFALPYMNHRADEYGGSMENCTRFAVALVKEIKKTCGADYPVAMRLGVRSYTKGFNQGALPGEEYTEAGRTLEMTKEAVKILDAAGVDLFDCDNGTYESYYWCHPPVYMKHNCNLADVEQLRAVTDKPIICTGMMTPDAASASIEAGKITAMGVGRQLLCDEAYARKIKEGRLDDIRPCIGCHACVPNNETGGYGDNCVSSNYGKCAQNPRVFEEKKYAVRQAKKPLRIAVIGAGIGGVECAVQLSRRGHTVDLYEKSDRIGGTFIAAAAPEFKEDDKKMIAWNERNLAAASVRVHFNTEITDLSRLYADEIVIATGAEPKHITFPGSGKKTLTAVDYLLRREDVGDAVAVVGGGVTGCEVAYELALRGKHPFVVEMQDRLMTDKSACAANTSMLRDELAFRKVPVYLGSKMSEVFEDHVTVQTPNGVKTVPCDSVITSVGFTSGSTLADKDKKHRHIHFIGDVNAVGNIKTAVYAANELALELSK